LLQPDYFFVVALLDLPFLMDTVYTIFIMDTIAQVTKETTGAVIMKRMKKLPGAVRMNVILDKEIMQGIDEAFHRFRLPSRMAAIRELLRIGIEQKLGKRKRKGE
jgi:hypothetical protein